MTRTLVAVLVVVFGTGAICGNPEYGGIRSKADNEVDLGWGRKIRLGAETDATLEGLKTTSGAGITKLTLKSSPAATMANGWAPAMAQYGVQQQNYVPILKQYGDNFVNGTNAVTAGIAQDIAAVTPLGTAFMAGHTQIAIAKAQQPQLISQLATLVGGGHVSLPQIAANDPALAAQVQTVVAKSLPASQPTVPQ